MNIDLFIILVLVIWNVALTTVVSIFAFKIRKFIKDVNKGELIKLLDRVISDEKNNSNNIKSIEKEILKMQDDAKKYIQKVAFMRFNPFEEMGGDQSFALALLDREDNGLIISGLHTRERTRVYVKNISGGKSSLELSKEEGKVLKQALSE